jgi:hypothetical protein
MPIKPFARSNTSLTENIPKGSGDRPAKDVIIAACGEVSLAVTLAY